MSDQISYEQQQNFLQSHLPSQEQQEQHQQQQQQQSHFQFQPQSEQSQPLPFEPTIEQLEQEKRRLQALNSGLDIDDQNTYTNPDLLNTNNNAAGIGGDSSASASASSSAPPSAAQLDAERRESDARSIYIGNVDYQSTPLELQQHFSSAGVVNRVTIMTNKVTGQPKGFAYLEFSDADAVNKAVATLDGSSFRERELKVLPKRTNIPGVNANRGGFRGGRGGIRGRGGFRGRGGMRGRGGFRGRGGRGGARFNPY